MKLRFCAALLLAVLALSLFTGCAAQAAQLDRAEDFVENRLDRAEDALESRIEAAAARAVKNAANCHVSMPDHFHMEIHFVNHTKAYSKHFYPGAQLKAGNIVCFDHDDWYEMLRFCHFVLSNA